MVEAEEGVRQGQHGGRMAALGPLSPPCLLVCFLPLRIGLQTLVRLMGASWAPGWSLGYGLLGSVAVQSWEGRKGVEGLIEALLHHHPFPQSLQLPHLLQPLEPFPFLQRWGCFRGAAFRGAAFCGAAFREAGFCGAGDVSRCCISCCTQSSLGSAQSSG